MKEIISKITSYNLYNYLFPGVIFVVGSEIFTSYSFLQNDLIIGAFVYYFIGLVISRFGSLLIEPALLKIKFLKFTDYNKFVSASEKDLKIELLSESNNSYRTISSMLILLLMLKFYEFITLRLSILSKHSALILIILLLLIFLCSYRKQTEYIMKRVKGK